MATRKDLIRIMDGKHHDKPPKYSRKGRQGRKVEREATKEIADTKTD